MERDKGPRSRALGKGTSVSGIFLALLLAHLLVTTVAYSGSQDLFHPWIHFFVPLLVPAPIYSIQLSPSFWTLWTTSGLHWLVTLKFWLTSGSLITGGGLPQLSLPLSPTGLPALGSSWELVSRMKRGSGPGLQNWKFAFDNFSSFGVNSI